MDEREWQTSTDPQTMLTFLGAAGRLSERKARLFAVACCRRLGRLLEDERSRTAVEVAERTADDLAGEAERQAAFRAACAARWGGRPTPDHWEALGTLENAYKVAYWAAGAAITIADPAPIPPAEVAGQVAFEVAMAVATAAPVSAPGDADAALDARAAARDAEQAVQSALLREIVGNPFRPLALNPAWLAWEGGTIPRLARAAYEDPELPAGTLKPALLAVLADALAEVGCQDVTLLGHLREPGPHVRGCWAVDLLREKT